MLRNRAYGGATGTFRAGLPLETPIALRGITFMEGCSMNSIFWIIGVIVVIIAILSLLGLT